MTWVGWKYAHRSRFLLTSPESYFEKSWEEWAMNSRTDMESTGFSEHLTELRERESPVCCKTRERIDRNQPLLRPCVLRRPERHYLSSAAQDMKLLLCSPLVSSRGPSTPFYPLPSSSLPNALTQTVRISLRALSNWSLSRAYGMKCFYSPHLPNEQTGSVVRYLAQGHRAVTELLLKPRSEPKLLVLNLDNRNGQIGKQWENFQVTIFHNYWILSWNCIKRKQ